MRDAFPTAPMTARLREFMACLLVLAMLVAIPAAAQPAGRQSYSQDELDQLLAPIALYSDELLSQILIAATYPLEVVEAARFVQQNPGLTGAALDQALAEKNWDPSVQSLGAFPQVLAMMNDELEWTQRLGDAFLVDPQRVMDTVQSLRQRAQAAGNLRSTPQESVITQDNAIMIEPVQPEVIYVPVYNPLYIYGPWWAPDYLPWFWYPPPIYGYPVGVVVTGIFFGPPCVVTHHHWGWARPDWHRHQIDLYAGNNRFWNRPGHPPPPTGGSWEHTPGHRRGIAYPNTATSDRFLHLDPNAVHARRDYRGYLPGQTANTVRPSPNAPRPMPGVGEPAPNVVRPAPGVTRPAPKAAPASPDVTRRAPGVAPPTPSAVRPTIIAPQAAQPQPRAVTPAFDPGVSRQQAQINAQRGMQSRQSIGGAAPSAPPGGASAPHGGVRRP
jgi:hypothetical protein